VKVRPAEMVDLVVVHPDHDPVKGADARHPTIIASATVRTGSSDKPLPTLVDRSCSDAS
jgi:hypothetical protein